MKTRPKENRLFIIQGELNIRVKLSTKQTWYAKENKHIAEELILSRKENDDSVVIHMTKDKFNKYFEVIE